MRNTADSAFCFGKRIWLRFPSEATASTFGHGQLSREPLRWRSSRRNCESPDGAIHVCEVLMAAKGFIVFFSPLPLADFFQNLNAVCQGWCIFCTFSF